MGPLRPNAANLQPAAMVGRPVVPGRVNAHRTDPLADCHSLVLVVSESRRTRFARDTIRSDARKNASPILNNPAEPGCSKSGVRRQISITKFRPHPQNQAIFPQSKGLSYRRETRNPEGCSRMTKKAKSLRISLTHGANRRMKVESAAELFDCGKSAAVMKCIDFTLKMAGDTAAVPNGRLADALDHPDMTPELAEVLTTEEIKLVYDVTADVEISTE